MKQSGWRRAVKRAADIAMATTAIVAASPAIAVAAVSIRATMGTPVVFRQPRPGEVGKVLEVYKCRTMRDAKPGEQGPEHDAARITRLGAFLRRSSIDELPQLVNILRGEMSLVGPRPLVTQYLSRYSEEQMRRHDVLPGLTGWAQVHGRNTISWDEKFAKDTWYVDNWGLRLDAKVLLKTVGMVLRGDGISSDGHATMPEFMGAAAMGEPAEPSFAVKPSVE